jgi:hypothetical protein
MSDRDQSDALIHHLVRTYWSGHLSYGEGLLGRFYELADTRARAEVLRFIGGCFLHTPGDLPAGIVEQSQRLWERRLDVAKQTATPDAGVEVAEFGWWFGSAKFPVQWSMRQLDAALNLTLLRGVEPFAGASCGGAA